MPCIIDATYLPFTENELRRHFLRGPDEQLRHFTKSADSYHEDGFLYEEYTCHPEALARDLPHRDEDWPVVARRLGWLTFEDIHEILPGACPWLNKD